MSPSQTHLFTVIPRGVTRNPNPMPVSVIVAPRLVGADHLGEFPDWLDWTARLRERGLRITLTCNGQTYTAEINREVLQPQLWRELFNEETYVRSHQFDDYSDRFIASYPVRLALSSLKGIYQTAGVVLALPQPDDREQQGQGRLRQLVDGWQIDWDEAKGDRWRDQQRVLQRRSGLTANIQGNGGIAASLLGSDGLLKTGLLQPGTPQATQIHQGVAQRFAVFSHVPAGAPVTREALDDRTVLDFHQALSSLNSYPLLLRQLGLVFDLELPLDFVAQTSSNTPGLLSVTQVEGDWSLPTTVPVTQTAYLHTGIGGGDRLFLTAPRALVTGNGPFGVLGLLALDPTRFGLAQVDVDGGLHKTVMLAETVHQVTAQGAAPAQHPEVFDPNATLSSLRSGGLSLYSDGRALGLLGSFMEAKEFNEALVGNQPLPRAFGAEDLVRGYRIDVWDAVTGTWHSLHRRRGVYQVGQQVVTAEDEEGFVQLAATQAPPNADGTRDRDDLYLHEAMARWNGWSLSADMPGKHLTRAADPDLAVPNPNAPDPENEPITPFPLTASYTVMPGSLPRLRFGGRYRFRARVVDLAGNSLGLNDPLSDLLARVLGLPNGEGTFPYLRFEPVAAPNLVLRDMQGITGPGSALDRIVIRTYNTDLSLDSQAADLTANDRHIAPPRGSVELGERHGIFDGPDGRLNPSSAMWELIRQRDAAQLNTVVEPSIVIDGEPQSFPLEATEQLALPYLPDPLARGAAIRDLPGTFTGTVGQGAPDTGTPGDIPYTPLEDANPRPGSATLISFGGRDDWQQMAPFRIALQEGTGVPQWDASARLLTVFLPKGHTQTVPLSCFMESEDLKLMGVWAWLREYVEYLTTNRPETEFYENFPSKDQIAHILQRAVEGGHWMLTPPLLLTLVHAVQQPLGVPAFTRLTAQFDPKSTSLLRTQPETDPTAETELDVLTAWRQPGSTDAYLVGGLQVHGASTAKVDLRAEWTDPVDDVSQPAPGEQSFAAFVDEVPLPTLREGLLLAKPFRPVGYYDLDHDLIGFAPSGTRLGNLTPGDQIYTDAAPRHQIGDARHHVVHYTAIATSRYRDYFTPQDADGNDRDFTRTSAPVSVHVPASARPLVPSVRYVVPTFDWQRETQTNLTRSLRQGGGLRVYLNRPWWSSGEGELLGVTCWTGNFSQLNREEWKPFVTFWGQDPVWQSEALSPIPATYHFPDAVASEYGLALDAIAADGKPRLVNVAGHRVAYDTDRQLWYCDLTVTTDSATYMPFVRLALVRYQPHALVEAKLSRVVLADFVQLTPERAAMITADPYQPGQIRVVVSGPAPQGPLPQTPTRPTTPVARPTVITVTVQERDESLQNSDLGWRDAAPGTVTLTVEASGPIASNANLSLWAGSLRFATPPQPGRFRLLITEREYLSADYVNVVPQRTARVVEPPSRLVYAEIVPLDAALLATPNVTANRTTV